ncbi:MAG: hypothetical protein GF364_20895, partial [Candidatus Lokiarchaeota archaeon]|nr:hypothetical protein [Candidatus Lokiarchaeota archaeon]
PIAGISILKRIMYNYISNGFTKFIVVISEEENAIKDTLLLLKNNLEEKIYLYFVIQEEAKGMADAILKTKDVIERNLKYDWFFVTASDVLFGDLTPNVMLTRHLDTNADITLSLVESKDPRMADTHGNVKIENGKVIKIIEKPGSEEKISDLYSMPVYILSKEVFSYLNKVKPSKRNELELQDAIQMMIDEQKTIIGVDILPEFKGNLPYDKVGDYHLTFVKDLLGMTFRFLKDMDLNFKGEYPTSIEPVGSDGLVEIGDSVLIGPNVFIGKKSVLNNLAEISNSILMGNNKIGKSVKIDGAIIAPDIEIEAKQVIKDSLILKSEQKEL